MIYREKKHNFLLAVVVMAISFTAVTSTSACDLEIYPYGAFAMPMGEMNDLWKSGFGLGIEGFLTTDKAYEWGVKVGYNNWTPNSEDLLTTGGRTLRVEEQRGVNQLYDLTALIRYQPITNANIIGGAGLSYQTASDVRVKGYFTHGMTAVSREIHYNASSSWAPTVILGIDYNLLNRLRPSIRYQMSFGGDPSPSFVSINVGLLGR